jgi:hypothetical protein
MWREFISCVKFVRVFVVFEAALSSYIIYTSSAIGRQLEAFMEVINE